MDRVSAQTDLLRNLLDAAMLRHQVIANNVANVNTPGYRRLEVSFENDFERALASGGETGRVQPHIVESASGTERADGNNVDIDQEMAALTKNALLFTAISQVLNGTMSQMRSAITGR